jgi:hypothetical protein
VNNFAGLISMRRCYVQLPISYDAMIVPLTTLQVLALMQPRSHRRRVL